MILLNNKINRDLKFIYNYAVDTHLLRYLCVRILEREELTKQCKKKQPRTGVASDLGGETTLEYHDE